MLAKSIGLAATGGAGGSLLLFTLGSTPLLILPLNIPGPEGFSR